MVHGSGSPEPRERFFYFFLKVPRLKILRSAMMAGGDHAIAASGKNVRAKNVFRAVFAALAGKNIHEGSGAGDGAGDRK